MPEETNNTQDAPAEEKTFTQAQMDAIIGDRLARERIRAIARNAALFE